jgi:hypothetical protein
MLTKGRSYAFRLSARNSAGYSIETSDIIILAAQVPDQPPVPQTVMSDDFNSLKVGWGMPADGSATITAYRVEILAADSVTWIEELTDCDATGQTIVDELQCFIPITTLLAEPFLHPWGAAIYARVAAINIVGESLMSDQGSGGLILRGPDPPINFQNMPSITNKEQIGIQWEKAPEEGGTPVIDY